jgi:hypothetical protein
MDKKLEKLFLHLFYGIPCYNEKIHIPFFVCWGSHNKAVSQLLRPRLVPPD